MLKSDPNKADPKSFIARYIRSLQMPAAVTGDIKAHYLDNVDFNDDDLIYSDVFTNKQRDILIFIAIPGQAKRNLKSNTSLQQILS